MKSWPLRIQITVLVGLVLTFACVLLTANSIYSARDYYNILDNPAQIEDAPDKAREIPNVPEGEMIFPDYASSYSIASRQFSIQSVVVMVAAVLCCVALTYWLTGRVLQPLTSLTTSISRMDQEKLHQRMELHQTAKEVRLLTESFNGMLDRLESAFEMQKNFAANAAHELKTPLAVLKTSLQVLEMDDEPAREDYEEFTAAAKAGIDRLTGTVDALMTLAWGDGRKNTEEICVRPLLELIFSELKTRTETGGVSLELTGDSPPLRSDPALVYRALFNLVENAVKYTLPGGHVQVSLSQQEGRIHIQVMDTGIGMSQETIAHAFEPFYRADSSRSQKIPGSGLGLSVVKSIVERLDGSIFLESVQGSGTTATLIL